MLLVVCPCGSGILHSENEVGQAMVAMEGGSTLECSERWCDDDSVVDFFIKDLCLVTGVEGDQNIGLGKQSSMWVESIVVSYPLGRGKEDEKGVEKGESASWQQEPSCWMLEKYKEFGVYLGASYVGYEGEVLGLLRAIE